MQNYKTEYEHWLTRPELDESTRAELMSIANDEKEQEERFYTELEFGTAGLRGIIGAGTNRMNGYVVRRATAGLAEYLLDTEGAKERGVAIAYDSRNCSDIFAKEAACTLAAYGVKCYLYSTLHSVPQLSFTVRELGCIAGIVITASHNPPAYNGYKVYWEHGGQCGPVQADEILARIRKLDYFSTRRMDYDKAIEKGLIKLIGSEIDEIYYKNTISLMLNPEIVREHGGDVKIVYTPLHGSGYVPITEVLKRIGMKSVYVVEEQAQPNGDFPTVKAPNPEDPNAFALAFRLADEVGAGLVIGSDPDSDRLGVAVRDANGEFQTLTGNRIGSILVHYLLSSMKEQGRLPENGLVIKSVVSTSLADAICRYYGVEIKHVLTGFRFIAEQMDLAESTGEHKFLFGFEESYGFLAGSFAHDKDAICAAMLISEAAVYYGTMGKTLLDVFNEMFKIYGYFTEKVKSYTLEGKEGMERIANAMKGLRDEPPMLFGSEECVVYEDLLENRRIDRATGEESETGFTKSNVLRYFLPGDTWIVVRPSGTEPKLKLYVGAKADSERAAEERMESLMGAADAIVSKLLG